MVRPFRKKGKNLGYRHNYLSGKPNVTDSYRFHAAIYLKMTQDEL